MNFFFVIYLNVFSINCNVNCKAEQETMRKLLETLSKDEDISQKSESESESESKSSKIKIIFDTDIGTDIDDSLALLMLLHLPSEDYELLGITTVYGYTHLRAEIADRIIKAYYSTKSEKPPPVTPGCQRPLGTHRAVWHTNTEGIPLFTTKQIETIQKRSPYFIGEHSEKNLDFADVQKSLLTQSGALIRRVISDSEKEDYKKQGFVRTTEAADWIIQTVKKHPHEVTLLCLGALSNVALALRKAPEISKLIKNIVYMGFGNPVRQEAVPKNLINTFPFEFQTGEKEDQNKFTKPNVLHCFYPNHNISSDTLAATIVFSNPDLKIKVINDTVTNRVWWTGDHTNALLNASYSQSELDAMGDDSETEKKGEQKKKVEEANTKQPEENRVVGTLLKVWFYYRSSMFYRKVRGTCPHDALSTAEAVYPGKFVKYVKGRVMIHEWAGFVSFVLDSNGNHEIGMEVDKDQFLKFFSENLVKEENGVDVKEEAANFVKNDINS